MAPLDLLNFEKNYNITIRTNGGGLSGQAEAILWFRNIKNFFNKYIFY
jgi:ribosomal protein S9